MAASMSWDAERPELLVQSLRDFCRRADTAHHRGRPGGGQDPREGNRLQCGDDTVAGHVGVQATDIELNYQVAERPAARRCSTPS